MLPCDSYCESLELIVLVNNLKEACYPDLGSAPVLAKIISKCFVFEPGILAYRNADYLGNISKLLNNVSCYTMLTAIHEYLYPYS